MPFQLTPEQEARAARLHAESFICDFIPHGEPILVEAPEEALMERGLAEGIPAGGVLDDLLQMQNERLEREPDFRQRYVESWRRSGLNCVIATMAGLDPRLDDHETTVRTIARWNRRIRACDLLTLATTPAEIERAYEAGKVAIIYGLQNSTYLGDDLDNLDVLYDLGLRVMQLTYNQRNLVGDGCTERVQGGLTNFGVQVVRRMNELGIVVDLSHCGYQTTLDGIEVSQRPVAFTHVGCRALYDHPRSKTDEQLRALADRDGYLGVYIVPFFLTDQEDPSLDLVMDHIAYAIDRVGPGRVGIGTDWGAFSKNIPERLAAGIRAQQVRRGFKAKAKKTYYLGMGEFQSLDDWHHLTRGLVARGYDDELIRDILGRNFLRFMHRAIG